MTGWFVLLACPLSVSTFNFGLFSVYNHQTGLTPGLPPFMGVIVAPSSQCTLDQGQDPSMTWAQPGPGLTHNTGIKVWASERERGNTDRPGGRLSDAACILHQFLNGNPDAVTRQTIFKHSRIKKRREVPKIRIACSLRNWRTIWWWSFSSF